MLSGQTRPKAGKPQISQISQIQPVSIDGLAIRHPENLRNRRNLRISLPGFLLPRSGPFSQATRAKSLVSRKLSVDRNGKRFEAARSSELPPGKQEGGKAGTGGGGGGGGGGVRRGGRRRAPAGGGREQAGGAPRRRPSPCVGDPNSEYS